MKKILLGALLLLSILSYSQNGNGSANSNNNGNGWGFGNGNGNNDDNDDDDDDGDDGPSAPIDTYIYLLGFVGTIYVGKKIILKNKQTLNE